jgi:hypothetical protein
LLHVFAGGLQHFELLLAECAFFLSCLLDELQIIDGLQRLMVIVTQGSEI